MAKKKKQLSQEYSDFNPLEDRDPRDFTTLDEAQISVGQRFRTAIQSNPSLYRLAVSFFTYVLTTRVIDLSHWNAVDMQGLKDGGTEGVILKVSQGVGHLDSKFKEFWNEALEAELLVMIYHFFLADYGGVAQADWFLEKAAEFLEAVGYKTVGWADVEDRNSAASPSKRANRLHIFLQTTDVTIPKVGFYSSPSLWTSLVGQYAESWSKLFYGWIAHWTPAPEPTLPAYWTTRKKTPFWQRGIYPTHSWIAPVLGAISSVDVNAFDGSPADLKLFVTGATAPPPTNGDCCDDLQNQLDQFAVRLTQAEYQISETESRLLVVEQRQDILEGGMEKFNEDMASFQEELNKYGLGLSELQRVLYQHHHETPKTETGAAIE